MATIPLKGSDRAPLSGSRAVGPADPAERLQVSVLVRRRGRPDLRDRVRRLASGDRSVGHLAREDFARQYGAEPADIAAVKKFAATHGLSVIQDDAGRRTVVLAGTVAQFQVAFGVRLQRFEHPRGAYRGRQGVIQLPQELDGVVEAVLGLDNRPQAQTHFRVQGAAAKHKAANSVVFTPIQVSTLYGYPQATGQGQCVGIIELGGGFTPSDLQTYFAKLKVATPTVTAVAVDGGQNAPTGDAERAGWGSDARYRSHRCDRAPGEHRGLFRSQHGCRFSGRGHHGDPRYDQQAVGPLYKLG